MWCLSVCVCSTCRRGRAGGCDHGHTQAHVKNLARGSPHRRPSPGGPTCALLACECVCVCVSGPIVNFCGVIVFVRVCVCARYCRCRQALRVARVTAAKTGLLRYETGVCLQLQRVYVLSALWSAEDCVCVGTCLLLCVPPCRPCVT